MAVVGVNKIIGPITVHPFNVGRPTLTGVQYTQIYNANIANTYITTNGGAFNVIDMTYPGGRGMFRELEVGLTAEYQANATTLMTYKWQGRNLNPPTNTWVDLTADELQVVTTAWSANTISGYIYPKSDFNSIPFEVRMTFRTNHELVGIGRVKNSSYVRALYQIN